MKFETKYKLMLLKNWVGKGQSETTIVKYLIGFYGLYSREIIIMLMIGCMYFLICLIIGFLWFRYGWVEAEAEVGNRYNKFQKEMREKLQKKRFK